MAVSNPDNEITIEVGRLTRLHAIIDPTEIGWVADGRLIATQEFLDNINDEELGEVVLNKAQHLLEQRIAQA